MRIIVLSDKKYSYEDFYNKISTPIKNSPLKYKIFLFVYRYLVYFTVLIYMALLIYCLIQGLYHQFFNAVLTPAITFIVVTIVRRLINAPRLYKVYSIKPLIAKKKEGESFPSRHTLSITIIAMVGVYVWWPVGIVLWIMSVCMGISRVLAGVHFPKDVLAAAMISIVAGMGMFFW